jgi:hypothetical protein
MTKENILLKCYLYDILGIQITIHRWKEQNKLPFFLTNTYDFNEIQLLGHPCLLMSAKKNAEVTTSEVLKHQKLVQKQWDGLCIYLPNKISAYSRKQLIEHQTPFIVPGNQLYVPDLGMDLCEHYRKLRRHPIKHFSPSTQAVVIHVLLRGIQAHFTPSELAKTLGYTLMTMTRAFDELEMANIGEIKRHGKERWWQFEGGKRELWNQAKPFMKTPVKKHTWAIHTKPIAIAGLSALAHYSMLKTPKRPTYALGVEQWKIWKQEGIEERPSAEDSSFDLEIWHYNPDLFLSKKSHIVDPFSLYLSLNLNVDERIESALSEMMEKITW